MQGPDSTTPVAHANAVRPAELPREVLDAVAAENHRIGLELHDHVGQHLTGLELLADSLTHRVAALDPAIRETVAKIARGLREVHADVRCLALGLSPNGVSPAGLEAALQFLAERVKHAGIAIDLRVTGPLRLADTAAATDLFRIAQESVSNCLRHAQATSIAVHLHGTPAAVTLEVRDDGVGLPEAGRDGNGLGLRLMHHRATRQGGTLAVTSTPGGGTRVVCRMPTADAAP
jgi:hypothetical protein